jgi:hypothetical protein
MRKGRKLAKNEETSWPTERISFFVKITSEKDREEIACGVGCTQQQCWSWRRPQDWVRLES